MVLISKSVHGQATLPSLSSICLLGHENSGSSCTACPAGQYNECISLTSKCVEFTSVVDTNYSYEVCFDGQVKRRRNGVFDKNLGTSQRNDGNQLNFINGDSCGTNGIDKMNIRC